MGRIDPSLPNRHRLHIGTSGSGKSSRIRELLRTEKPAHVLAYDPDEDFPLHRLTSVAAFGRALAGAARSGKRMRLACTVPASPESFRRWCQMVWTVRDAARPVVLIVDELAAVQRGPGKAPPEWGAITTRGRKYGLIVWASTQRPQEIDKTLYSNVGCLWSGRLRTTADCQRVAAEMDVPAADLAGLGPLEYVERWAGEPPQRGRVKMPRAR